MSTLAFLPRSMQGLISAAVLPSASRHARCRACDSPRRHCDEQPLHADHGAQLGPARGLLAALATSLPPPTPPPGTMNPVPLGNPDGGGVVVDGSRRHGTCSRGAGFEARPEARVMTSPDTRTDKKTGAKTAMSGKKLMTRQECGIRAI